MIQNKTWHRIRQEPEDFSGGRRCSAMQYLFVGIRNAQEWPRYPSTGEKLSI